MKVYVSGSYDSGARDVAARLVESGMTVVSTWHDGECPRTADRGEQDLADWAERTLGEIADADALVLISSDRPSSGVKFLEAGFALGCMTAVFVLGSLENNLLRHPLVELAPDIDCLVNGLWALAQEVEVEVAAVVG